MEKAAKCRRRRTGGEASAGPIDGDRFEAGCGVPLPAAPVCRALRFSVSPVLSTISALDHSGFASSGMIISRILGDNCGLRSLILDCSRLHDFSVNITAKDHLEELVFPKCYCFTSYIFLAIAQNCTNLR